MPKKQNILVVDDDVEIVEYMETLLTMKGYDVLKAYNGHDGLEKAKNEKPDLILLDFLMPGISGMEVCRLLKADPLTKNIPIILLSSVESLDIVKSFLQMGVAECIKKPPDPKILIDKIEMAIEMR